MNRRQFLQWGALGGATALVASFFLEPTVRLWRKVIEFLDRQPFLRLPAPAPQVAGKSTVFHVTGVPVLTGGQHPGLDGLLELMAQNDVLFYQTEMAAPWAGPSGLIASDDVVLIKVNSQWPERGMTSTDLVRGLIQSLMAHPAGFTGEIVIVENGQTQDYLSSPNQNNDDTPDHSQSIQRIVADFNSEQVSLFNWRLVGQRVVNEFDAGDDRDGYVLFGNYPLNYPKFTTARGTRISLKRGIWNGKAYDESRLKLINLPVLKAHVFMGATGAVKNYAGVMSRFVGEFGPGDDWDYHANFYGSWNGNPSGLLGILLAMRFPTVTIMDATYVNPFTNWAAGFETTPHVGALLASIDPIALDYYASKHVLLPMRRAANAKRVTWSDPDAASVLRRYLLATQARLLETGYSVRFGDEAIQSVTIDMMRS